MKQKGKVYLIGAGPGHPELLTVKAARVIQEADAVVFDRLVSPEILSLICETALQVPVGKSADNHPVPQERINEILKDLAQKGMVVARLKGGDPLIFGRGSEEAEYLRANDVTVEYVPGITAAQGMAASTGVPLTHRGLATGVRYVTGHRQANGSLDLDWKSLACTDTTLVIYMGVANIAQISMRLQAEGLSEDTPVLAVASATTPREKRVYSRLGRIAADIHDAGLKAPVLFVIGKVVMMGEDWQTNTVEEILSAARVNTCGKLAHG